MRQKTIRQLTDPPVETKLSSAFHSLEATVPFENSWEDERDVVATTNYAPIDIDNPVSCRALVSRRPIRFEPFTGGHVFWHSGHLILFRHVEWNSNEQNSFPRYYLMIETPGRSLAPIKSLLDDAQSYVQTKNANTTTVYRGEIEENSSARWSYITSRPSRNINTVILSQGKKQAVLRDINEYLHPSTREWYNDHGIPYRRGYLFSGAPGTGKTTLSSAIAGLFGMDIYVLSLVDAKMTETHLSKLFSELPTRCMLLLEDIDAAGLVRDDALKPKNSKISLSAFLNVIDGVSSPEGRVLVMTTNHAETLDPALIRPGRVDMTIEFELPKKEEIRALFLSLYSSYGKQRIENASGDDVSDNLRKHRNALDEYDLDALATSFAKELPSEKLSIAAIQGFLLRNKTDPEEAVKKAKAWSEETLRAV